MWETNRLPVALLLHRVLCRCSLRRYKKIAANDFKKGNVFEVARLTGIMATKRTADLIPLCHLLPLELTKIEIEAVQPDQVKIIATVSVHAKTGIEMEALMAVSIAALTIYDMCKAIDRSMEIGPIHLLEKLGGRKKTVPATFKSSDPHGTNF